MITIIYDFCFSVVSSVGEMAPSLVMPLSLNKSRKVWGHKQ